MTMTRDTTLKAFGCQFIVIVFVRVCFCILTEDILFNLHTWSRICEPYAIVRYLHRRMRFEWIDPSTALHFGFVFNALQRIGSVHLHKIDTRYFSGRRNMLTPYSCRWQCAGQLFCGFTAHTHTHDTTRRVGFRT